MSTYEISVKAGYAMVSVSDAVIKCDVSDGPIHLIFSTPGVSSKYGVVISKFGDNHNIHFNPDTKENVILTDNDGPVDMLIMRKDKKRDVLMHYNIDRRTWLLVEPE